MGRGTLLSLLLFLLLVLSGAFGVDTQPSTVDCASAAAQIALGDARAASGNLAEALAAYIEAINLTPPGAHPPAKLFMRVSELRREMLATAAATRPSATAPTAEDAPADEIAYYKLITEGDAARRNGKLPDALRAYQRAQRYHHDHKMKLPTGELDEKIAYTRELQQKQPAGPPRARPAQRAQPQKPQSTRPSTRPG